MAADAYVFDIETDRLLDATRSNFADLRITVAAGAWVALPDRAGGPAAAPLSADDIDEFLLDGTDDDGALARLASCLDRAATIVAYNGRGFDFKVLAACLGEARVAPWLERLRDPFEVIRARRDSWVKLDELLLANGLEGKSGDGVDAVTWWRNGERRKVADYCKSDVSALSQLACLEDIRFPVKRWSRAARAATVMEWDTLRWGRVLRAARGMLPVEPIGATAPRA